MPRKTEPRYMTEQQVFPTRLRELMKERGINQKELATAIGMRPQTVSLYTGGQSAPDINCLRKIAEYFHVSADWLIGLADPDNSTADEKLRMSSEYTGLSNEAVQNLHDFLSSPFRHTHKKWCNYLLTSGNFMALSIGLTCYEAAFAKSTVEEWRHEKEDAEKGIKCIRINTGPTFDEARCAAGWRLSEVVHEMTEDVEKSFGIDGEAFIEACVDLIKDKTEFADFIEYAKSRNEK